ncbi:enzymatic polyprotein, partial [Trifolium medium]|nr:enzymatic polyprotein [Trifolium medium]
MQEERPIAYFSQKLSLRAQQKSAYERELMAIVLAVQKWRHYLLGLRFTVRTDQQSLQFLTDQNLLGGEQAKWTSKLLGF